MRGHWIIDSYGDVWSEHDPDLSRSLNTRRTGAGLTEFLVCQMGYVAIREFATRTEILFDPAVVSSVALTQYYYWAADRQFRLTTCVDAANPCVSTMFHKPLALHNFIGAAIEARTPRPDFAQQAIEVDQSSFATRWRAALDICSAPMDAPLKLNIIENLFSGHFVMAERGADGDYLMTHAGVTLKGYDMGFMANLQGRSFRAAADKSYGDWTAERYRGIRSTDAPITESVSALIAFRDRGRKRYFYERLIIPMASRSGADALLIAVNRN
jgi:hypothetical protein